MTSPFMDFNGWQHPIARKKRKVPEGALWILLGAVCLFAFVLYAVQPDRELLAQSRRKNKLACDLNDPWHEPGYVLWNTTNAYSSRWTTVLPSKCPRRNYLLELLDTTLKRDDPKLKRIVGKTVVILGDEMDKQGTRHLCTMLSEDGLTRAKDLRLPSTSGSTRTLVTVGRVCEALRLDFRIAVFDLEPSGAAESSSIYVTGGDRALHFEKRLQESILPTLLPILEGHQPGLVILSPGMRDLNAMGRQDELHQVELNSPLSHFRIDRLIKTMNDFVHSAMLVFPSSPIALRSLPRAATPHRQGHPSRFLHDIRVHQLRGVVNTIAETNDLAYFDLAKAVNGYQREEDELPFSPGGVLYAQGLLHHLNNLMRLHLDGKTVSAYGGEICSSISQVFLHDQSRKRRKRDGMHSSRHD